MNATRRYPWFVKGDLDGFFGLAVDNLVQVLVIVALCKSLCGFGDDLIYSRILPGIAVSLLETLSKRVRELTDRLMV